MQLGVDLLAARPNARQAAADVGPGDDAIAPSPIPLQPVERVDAAPRAVPPERRRRTCQPPRPRPTVARSRLSAMNASSAASSSHTANSAVRRSRRPGRCRSRSRCRAAARTAGRRRAQVGRSVARRAQRQRARPGARDEVEGRDPGHRSVMLSPNGLADRHPARRAGHRRRRLSDRIDPGRQHASPAAASPTCATSATATPATGTPRRSSGGGRRSRSSSATSSRGRRQRRSGCCSPTTASGGCRTSDRRGDGRPRVPGLRRVPRWAQRADVRRRRARVQPAVGRDRDRRAARRVRRRPGRSPSAPASAIVAFPLVQLVVDGPYRTAATGVLMTFIGLRFAAARPRPIAARARRRRDRSRSG